jgi:hypothetical protein
MAHSDNQYQENLDILQTMIDKYVDSHTIIICGDMNGSPSIERNNINQTDWFIFGLYFCCNYSFISIG